MARGIDEWVPFEWPESWASPELLHLLKGTPFNCLLLTDAQTKVREAAGAQGFHCPGNVRWQSWREAEWSKPGELLAISDGFWPELSSKGDGSEQAGPTGAPWLDANGWLLEMARVRLPASTTIWIKSDLPEDPRSLRWLHYQLALLEAWAYGASRPLRLSAPHAEALREGNQDAKRNWDTLMSAAAWMRQRRDWSSHRPFARLAIASDFTGPNEYISTETLLLAARQGIAFVPVESARVTPAALRGIRALLWCDPAPVPPGVLDWVRAGGRLMAMPSAVRRWQLGPAGSEDHPRFRTHRLGKGSVAVARGEFDDPWLLAQDTRLVASKQFDAVRLFNAGSLQYRHASAAGRHYVYLLNYTLRPSANRAVVQIAMPVRAARLHAPGMEPQPMELHQEGGGIEVNLPGFAVCAVVEFEEGVSRNANS